MTYIFCFQTPLSFYRSIFSSHTASSPGVAPWSRRRYGIDNSRIAWRCGIVANENGDALQIADFVGFLGKNVRLAISCQKLFSRLYQRHMATNHRWKVRGNYYCQRADFRCHSDRFVALSCKIFSAFTWANVSRYDSTIRMAGNPDRRLIMKKENPAFRATRSSNGGWRSSAGIRRLSLR